MSAFFYKTSEEGLVITRTSGISEEEVLVVPAMIDGQAVYAIGYAAFYNCAVKKIVISEGIRRIEGHAFAKSSRLRELTLPDSLEYIGALAFNGCMELESLKIPEGVRQIDNEAFSWCRGLRSVSFSCRDALIGERAFYFCLGLREPLLLKGVREVGRAAFSACMNLPEIRLSAELQSLGNFAFQDCYALSEIHFEKPSGLREMGNDVFSDCRNLRTAELPDSLRSIGIGTFRDCGKLSGVVLPGSIGTIPSWTFSNCRSLLRAEIPDGIRRLEPFAFHKCQSLVTVRLAPSVTELADHAFTECTALKSLDLRRVRKAVRQAFSYCNALEMLEISLRLKRIGRGTLFHCGSMTGVWLYADRLLPDTDPVFVPFEPAGLRWMREQTEEDGQYDFSSYDGFFDRLCRFRSKSRTALWRLQNPEGLSTEARGRYLAYLRRVSHRIVREALADDDIHLIGRMGELGLIPERHCDEYISMAGAAGARCTGYLINYRRTRFGQRQIRKRYAL